MLSTELKEGPAQAAIASPSSLRRNRPFQLLISGYTVSVLGNGFHSIALSLWILQTTDSAKYMSVVMIIQMVLNLLFGAVAGTIADRSNRIRLMFRVDLIRASLTFGVAACVALAPGQLWLVFLLIGLTGFSGLFHSPALQSSLVRFAGQENIQRSTGMVYICDNAARISGLALGGTMAALIGGPLAIMIDGFTFLMSAFLIRTAGKLVEAQEARRPDEPATGEEEAAEEPPRNTFLKDLKLGYRFVMEDIVARSVVALYPLLMLFFLSSLMLVQVMAVKVWKVAPSVFGLIEASFPVGYLIGSSFIMAFDKKLRRRGWLICGSIMLLGPIYMVLSSVRSVSISLPLVLLAGIVFAFCTLLINIMLRLRVETDKLGRVFGIMGSLSSVAPPIGLAAASYSADRFGVSATLWTTGLCLGITGIIGASLLKSIRSFN